MILVVLAVIWAAAFLPPFVRSRLEGNPVDSIGRFRRHLRVLESATPVSAAGTFAHDPVGGTLRPLPSPWAQEARRLRLLRRRQQVALGLLTVMGATLLLGLVPALHLLLVAQVGADVVFLGYVILLVQARNAEMQRQLNVHFASFRTAADEGDVLTDVLTPVSAPVLRQQAL